MSRRPLPSYAPLLVAVPLAAILAAWLTGRSSPTGTGSGRGTASVGSTTILASPGWAAFEIEDVPGGVRVVKVLRGGPADVAGIAAGDVLVRVGGEPATMLAVSRAIRTARVGSPIVFDRERPGGESGVVPVTLEGTDALLARVLSRGASALASLQRADGLWPDFHGERPGAAVSALACAALAAARPKGERASEPLDRGLAALIARRASDGGVHDPVGATVQHRVYANALLLLALARSDSPVGEAASVRAWLAGSQIGDDLVDPLDYRSGGFPYYEGRDVATLRADVSVAAWALEALAASGLPATRPEWARAGRFLERCQNREVFSRSAADRAREAALRDGGFGFMPRSSKAGSVAVGDDLLVFTSYGSATADGVRGLLAASAGDARDERTDAGLRWLARSYTLERNPGFGDRDAAGWARGIHFYWLASLARALHAAKVDAVVRGSEEHAWPGELARFLAHAQDESGAWASKSALMAEDSPVVATSLALLALAAARDRADARDGRALDGGSAPPPPPPEIAPWEPAAASVVERGRALFSRLGCVGCDGDREVANGPSLVGIADRYLDRKRTHAAAAEYLTRHIRDPEKYPGLNGRAWGEHRMPRFSAEAGLPDADLEHVVEFLLSRTGDLPVSEAPAPR